MSSTIAQLVRTGNGRMNYIDYSKYNDNKEFLRGDQWEFKMEAPHIVYYPGDDIFNTRLNSIQINLDSSVNGFVKRVRGNFEIRQQTGQSTSGTISLNFIDREDQAISYFVDDWKQKISDRDTKYSFRKSDIVCPHCYLYITNSSRLDVRTLKFYNCVIMDAPLDENGAEMDGTDRSDVMLTLAFEHYERDFDNLSASTL